MKYEGFWRRITVSASYYYADIFLWGLGQPKARDKRSVLKNKTWIRIAGRRYEV
jgi:hypothetical protein